VAVGESEPPTVLTVAPPTETLRNPAWKPVITNDFNEYKKNSFLLSCLVYLLKIIDYTIKTIRNTIRYLSVQSGKRTRDGYR